MQDYETARFSKFSEKISENTEIGKGLLEEIVSDRAKILKSTVLNLLDEIKARENLSKSLISEIDAELTTTKSKLSHLNDQLFHYNLLIFKEMNSLKRNAERNIIILEQEARRERLEFWKDSAALKKYLMSALREFWDLSKRREMLFRK